MSRWLLMGIALIAWAGCASLRTPPGLPFETVTLPAGGFWMGDVFEGENDDATPVHRAIVPALEIGRHEITFAQYDTFAVQTSRPLPDDNDEGRGDRAVVNVTWEEALAYCQHYGFRLPAEVEWEYAARSMGQRHLYPGADTLDDLGTVAWYEDNSPFQSMLVGVKKPNEAGLYDMSGNVFEWIGDYYEFYPPADSTPVYKDLTISSMRIIRGGSYKSSATYAQTFWRAGTLADFPADDVGFRCAREAIR